MEYGQIYGLVNSITKQTMGETPIEAVDTSTLVSVGDSLINANMTDNWCKTLLDRIGLTLTSNRKYAGSQRKIFRSALEYGIIMQKLYVEQPTAVANQGWVSSNADRKSQFEINKLNVIQTLFTGNNGFELPMTIPDWQFKTAFTNAEQMGAFIEGHMISMENAFTVALEDLENLAVAKFISKKMDNQTSNPLGAVNLIEEYKLATGNTTTVAKCLTDTNFLKFASAYISNLIVRLSKPSKLYNIQPSEESNVSRHTNAENICIDLLLDFTSAFKTYLQADTFHRDLVALPKYTEIPYWQAPGETANFKDNSTVFVDTNKYQNIIGVLYDYNAIGSTIERQYTATARDERLHFTNFFKQADINYFVDLSENGVVFYLADVA